MASSKVKSKTPLEALENTRKQEKTQKTKSSPTTLPQQVLQNKKSRPIHDQMPLATERQAAMSRERVWEPGAPDQGPHKPQKQELKNKSVSKRMVAGCIAPQTTHILQTSDRRLSNLPGTRRDEGEGLLWPRSPLMASQLAPLIQRGEVLLSFLPEPGPSPAHGLCTQVP